MKVKDFKPAKYNPRKITDAALKALDKSIEEFGDLSGVVINKKTNTIVAGHQRLTTIGKKKTKIATKAAPDKFGTVEVGYIEVIAAKGDRFSIPLRIVNWDLRREKMANIAANNHGGEFDNQKLGKLLAELEGDKFDIELSGFSEGEVENLMRKAKPEMVEDQRYVRKLTSPIYEVTGKKPKLSQVYDTTKTDELKAAIAKVKKIPDDVRAMLNAAAERHTKFSFTNAAEYYAHASPDVQALMEDCALVIIDHDKAIEHGYLKLTEEIMDMVKNGQE